MKTLRERLEHCNWQIAQAIEESHRPHTEAEHLGILLGEMDRRAEREHVLVELAAQTEAACNAATTTQRLRARRQLSTTNQEKEPTPNVE